jgi:hypothetical protein
MNDYFQSHTVSLVLTWLFSIPFIVGPIAVAIEMLFEKTKGISRFFVIWLLICVLLFSPFRYSLLQIFMAIAYPFQSIHALLTTIILALPISVVFGVLYGIGLWLPWEGIVVIAGDENTPSKIRLWLAAMAAPILYLISSYLFYLVLPYAAYPMHLSMIDAQDVIRTTNGPAGYFYKYAIEPSCSLEFPVFVDKVGWEKMSAKERLRAHVAGLYLNEREFVYYISKAYPAYFEECKRKYKMNQQQAEP